MISQLDEIKQSLFYFLICVILVGLNYFTQSFFLTENIFVNTYSELMSYERIGEVFEQTQKYQWISFLFIPVFLIFKVMYNSLWITTGTLLKDDSSYTYEHNFTICLKAELIFVIMLVFRIGALLLYNTVNVINDINFIPGSIINFFNSEELPKWSIYPLKTLNVWEVLYCYLGTKLFAYKYNISVRSAAYLFCIPYVLGLFFLILVYMFLIFQLSE